MPATKFRLRFAKHGDLRLVSHHDLLRCLERALRRSGLPLARSQGFNPRPKISFPLALGLGIEGRREILELELSEPLTPEEVRARLQAAAPPGFDIVAAEPLERGSRTRVVAACYELHLPPGHQAAARTAWATFLASSTWPYQRRRPDRTIEADLRPFLLDGALDPEGTLRFCMRIIPEGSARPEELLEALGLTAVLEAGGVLVRTDLELETITTVPPRLTQECETA